ncbi:hypothetical protein JWG41_04265 [Leptospira sp. 201903075]|uniref:hypothetical protein n=1 Tax=Leptospira chreensis TaxID=2810035 RepID=UPI001962EDA3|nr:hypothetical protein [Leptospira chreensis]MBM9589645.1 hypothetical protein [Leptospira chreensis]
MKLISFCFIVLVTVTGCRASIPFVILERKEKKIEWRTRIPFKIQFRLDEKIDEKSQDLLQILGKELIGKSRVDIQGVLFPVESVFEYDEIEELTVYQNAAFKDETHIYIVPTPGLIYVQTNSDQYIITGYLIKYENNK